MLQTAAYNSYNVLLQLLIRRESNPNINCDIFEELLQLRCINGHIDIVQQLLYLGASPSKADEHGWTSLFCTSWFRQDQILDYLLLHRGESDLLLHVNTIPPNS
jgi:ankyrin repeat protein